MARKYRKGPKSLTELIGADYDILRQSGSSVVRTFYWAAFTLVVISVLTFLSVREAMNMLFHSIEVELLFSLFFSGLFLLMYVFLLNTFSNPSLDKRGNLLSASNVTRITFVVFMAFMISKPLEVRLLNSYITIETEQYKSQLLSNYKQRLDMLVEKDVVRFHKRKNYLRTQQQLRSSNAITQEIHEIDESLVNIESKNERHFTLANEKIAKSDFFIFKIKSVTHHALGWFAFLGILVLFLLPGYLVYSIAEDDSYYMHKKEQENNIVLRHYKEFLLRYSRVFSQKYGRSISYYSVFADAPYNTKRKSDNKYNSQKDFLDRFMTPET